jgi:SAM-dependent methyltransferase
LLLETALVSVRRLIPGFARPGASSAEPQADLNRRAWSRGRALRVYANRQLRPVEVTVLVRYRDQLSGRLLELGPGGGRLTGYLTQIARETRGLELARPMIKYAQARYPEAHFDHGDLRDLSRYADGSFGAVLAPFNVLDVLGDAERRRVLGDVGRILEAGGLFVLSTHNRGAAADVPPPTRVRRDDPLHFAADLVRMPRRVRNHRRLAGAEAEHQGYEIVNDGALDYALLHYYIAPPDQARQLAELGFELLECLDLEGRAVDVTAGSSTSSELHYVARRAPTMGAPSSA